MESPERPIALGIHALVRSWWTSLHSIVQNDGYDHAEALHSLSEILYTNLELTDLVRESEKSLAKILKAESVTIRFSEERGIDTPDFDALATEHIVAIPIAIGTHTIGTISFEKRLSGKPYSENDLKLLKTFAYQAATAFHRAHLYTKTKEHANELEHIVAKRTQELRRAQAHERRMIIDLSHNLQTPLTVFRAKLEQLKSQHQEAEALELALNELSGFIHDLLALARLDGEKPRAHALFDISVLLSDIIEELRIISASEGVHIESDIPPGVEVYGDEKHLRQAVLNIANNSLKYMREGADRRVEITLTQSTDGIHLIVRDSGIGIAPTELSRVFDRFYRGKNVPLTVLGSGLGLSITKRIVEKHHGHMDIESELGAGTTVHVYLPALIGDEAGKVHELDSEEAGIEEEEDNPFLAREDGMGASEEVEEDEPDEHEERGRDELARLDDEPAR